MTPGLSRVLMNDAFDQEQLSANLAGSFQTLRAKVPLSEVADYATTLGSLTAGQGTYSIEMSHYEPAPSNVQQKICEQNRKQVESDD